MFTVVILGAEGITFGTAVALPAVLVHPFSVCVTLYVPGVNTVIDVVIAPVFHNNDPVKLPAVNTELPQLFATVTAGGDGIIFGADVLLAGELVHPPTVCVTLYKAALVTVIDVVVALLLHINDPPKLAAVNTELPQLFTILIVGVVGTVRGADIPLPPELAHPFTVCVTVYVAAFVTVIDVVVALLLHNNDPVKLPAVNTELPQLFATPTVGAAGITLGADEPIPVGLVHPFTV